MNAQVLAYPQVTEVGSHVSRQVILDSAGAVLAWELFDGSGAPTHPERDAETFLQAISLLSTKAISKRRMLFLRCAADSLASEHLELIEPSHVVLDLALPAHSDPARVKAMEPMLAAVSRRGFRIALPHDALGSAWQTWLPYASFMKLETARLPEPAIGPLVQLARARDRLRVIGCGVDDQVQYQWARSLGLDLFQGRWFAEPMPVKADSLRPTQAMIHRLIILLRNEADLTDIEDLLKHDPALGFNLMRYINSGGFGLQTKVTSFRHAVMVLGLRRMTRWAALLMATSRDVSLPAIGHTAVVRGRLMELLAAELLPQEQRDQAFVVGVFSLLHLMTGMPIERALEGLPLPEPVLDALLHGRGQLAVFLELTEACERADDAVFSRTASQLKLSGRQVNMAHLQALAWAEELLAV